MTYVCMFWLLFRVSAQYWQTHLVCVLCTVQDVGISIVKHKPIKDKKTLPGCHYIVIMCFQTHWPVSQECHQSSKGIYIFTICDLLSENLALPANIKFKLRRDDFIRTGRFSAKLRLLHQGVTGGLHCIILNYEARQRCYKLELTGRSQWNMGTRCYGQLKHTFAKKAILKASSLYMVSFLAIDTI